MLEYLPSHGGEKNYKMWSEIGIKRVQFGPIVNVFATCFNRKVTRQNLTLWQAWFLISVVVSQNHRKWILELDLNNYFFTSEFWFLNVILLILLFIFVKNASKITTMVYSLYKNNYETKKKFNNFLKCFSSWKAKIE